MQAVLRLYKDVDGYIRENYNTVRGEAQLSMPDRTLALIIPFAEGKFQSEVVRLQGGKADLDPQRVKKSLVGASDHTGPLKNAWFFGGKYR